MAEPRTDPPTWDDVVNRLDVTERRSSRRLRRDLYTDVVNSLDGRLSPIRQRRRAGLAVRDALAVYRLAGGDPDHLLRVVAAGARPDDVVVGCLGDRARLARARVELSLEHPRECIGADDHAAHLADVEQRAAALERPRTDERTAPGDLVVTTPGEYAAARVYHVPTLPDPVVDAFVRSEPDD